MNHKAIRALYTNVVIIDDGMGAFDAQGNKVDINMDVINAWTDPEAYKEQRAKAYPSFADQFDTLYHGGYDAWKTSIQTIKDRFPK